MNSFAYITVLLSALFKYEHWFYITNYYGINCCFKLLCYIYNGYKYWIVGTILTQLKMFWFGTYLKKKRKLLIKISIKSNILNYVIACEIKTISLLKEAKKSL